MPGHQMVEWALQLQCTNKMTKKLICVHKITPLKCKYFQPDLLEVRCKHSYKYEFCDCAWRAAHEDENKDEEKGRT